MLRSIEVDNFKSFKKRTKIDFSATNYKALNKKNVDLDSKIVKGALFIGGNAVGKTNLLKSIRFLFEMLFKEQKEIPTFLKNLFTDNDNYFLKYEFEFDKKIVEYSFVINVTGLKSIIKSEKLIVDNIEFINRTNKKIILKNKNIDTTNIVEDNVLLLRSLYFNNFSVFKESEILLKFISFLEKSVYVNCNNKRIFPNKVRENLLIHDFIKENNLGEVNEILKSFNLGFELEIMDLGANQNGDFYEKILMFKKDNHSKAVPEFVESTGNKTLVEIILSFIHATKNNCILLVDEFNSGFHNDLEEALVSWFMTKSKKSQIFMVSHSTNLLNTSLLRPDQIFNCRYSADDGTTVYKSSNERVRETQNLEKMYLSGVFNGTTDIKKRF